VGHCRPTPPIRAAVTSRGVEVVADKDTVRNGLFAALSSAMSNGMSREELRRMRELAVKGRLTEERMIDVAAVSEEEEAEIVHLTDVVEMQSLLARAADEIERLYSRSQLDG
jgi:hypothetical protein